jgi:bifunctional UDP-N-acetylglucosamine pyrophosphorylase/glucosamine-1-phosphate N-acetyltransferase
MPVALIVLAAGRGTRMHSDLPKVLHPLGGVPMLAHVLAAGRALGPERVIVVAGHEAGRVAAAARAFDEAAEVVVQTPQAGTAHAVLQATPALAGFAGDAVVLCGDTPFLSAATLGRLLEARRRFDVVVLGFATPDPGRYGRLVTAGDDLLAIVEARDAGPEHLAIELCNAGVMAADAAVLLALATRVGNANAAGEYYLTDVVAEARRAGLAAGVVRCDGAEALGINTRAELAAAEAAFQARMRAEMRETGVIMTDPATVYFALDTVIGRDALVGPHVVFGPGVTVETGAEIRAFCHLEGCHISRGATVGPFARLRPGSELAEEVHVGNFVEIKNAILDRGVKVGHLAYLGDAEVGEGANIGAGTVTCNYDGVSKHRSTIGPRAFLGSDTMLVAPVRIGAGAYTATGSVITEDVPDAALAIARARQVTKPGLARRLLERLRTAREG